MIPTPQFRALTASALCIALSSMTAPAFAQDAIAPNRYRPSFAGDRFFAVGSPYAAGHLDLHGMLLLDYGHDPLVLRTASGGEETSVGSVVEHQLFMHLNTTFSLFDRVALNLEAPIALYQDGADPVVGGTTFSSPSAGQFGDLRIGLRGRLYGEYDDPIQLGLTGYLWVPTGTDDFVSNDGVYGTPLFNLGGTVANRFVYAIEVGPELRPGAVYANTSQGHSFTIGVASGVLLGEERRVQLGVETYGAVPLTDDRPRASNLELLGGARWRFVDDWVLGAAVGPGLTSGVGTPVVRALGSIAYTPDQTRPADRDGDGIVDHVDACPDVAGIPSDDPERHGCPAQADPDSDADGIVDRVDACPDVAGVPSDDPQAHGCPDADGDGIVDGTDACPQVPGPPNDDPSQHGCPPPGDDDGDGIVNADDACPKAPGLANQDPSLNGCPDSDGDTILDPQDACPKLAGPAHPDPKQHGCPPKDTDGDGIVDGDDACPKDPGPKSDDPEKNGCPKVVVTDKQIVIMERVEFATGKSIIRASSSDLLDEVAETFLKHPEILKVEVQGHTDDRGGAALNRRLSNARAEAVVDALVNRGVDRARLTAKGYGPDRPIATNDTPDGRQKNRRVQFDILERKKKSAP